MYHLEESQMDNFHGGYATHADFCQVFARDLNQFYLLVFLLTPITRRLKNVL
jgi:hypothetical protein